MKNFTKKILTVILTTFMFFGVVANTNHVHAISSANDKVTLQVEGLEEGDKVTFYKLAEVTYNEAGDALKPRDEWNYATKGTSATKLVIGDGDDKDLPEATLGTSTTEAQIQALARGILTTTPADRIHPIHTYSDIAAVKEDNKWVAKKSDLPAGIYLAIIESGSGERSYNPVYLSATYSGDQFAPTANEYVENSNNEGKYVKITKADEEPQYISGDDTVPEGWTIEEGKTYDLVQKFDMGTDTDPATYLFTGTAKYSTPGVDKKIDGSTVVMDNSGDITDDYDEDTAQAAKGKKTVKLGDIVGYDVDIDVPKYPYASTNKTIWVQDTMEKGLTFVPETLQLHLNHGKTSVASITPVAYNATTHADAADASPLSPKAGDYIALNSDDEIVAVFTYVSVAEGQAGSGFKAVFDYEKIVTRAEVAVVNPQTGTSTNQNIGSPTPMDDICITYGARVNESAELGRVGNKNKVEYAYAKNSNKGETVKDTSQKPNASDYNWFEDEEIVYLYEISILKYDEACLKKADSFTPITEANDGAIVFYKKFKTTEQKELDTFTTEAPTDANGTLYEGYNASVTEQSYTKYKLSSSACLLKGAEFKVTGPNNFETTVVTNDKGIATVTDLSKGTYTFTETKAPQGYTLSTTHPQTVTVDAQWTSATKTITNGPSETTVYSVIENTDSTSTQIGWLIGGTGSGKFYALDEFPIGTNAWTYDATEHKLTRTINGVEQVIPNVYKAKAHVTVTKATTTQETIKNNGNAEYVVDENGTYRKATHTDGSVKYVVDGTEVDDGWTIDTNTLYKFDPKGVVFLHAVANTTVNELPSTGGIGTYLFTIAGVAIIATAAFMLIFRKKEGHNH